MTERFINEHNEWRAVERPGYQGKRKDADIERWNREYGEDNWRLSWEIHEGETVGFEGIFYRIYVPGYTRYFLLNPEDALFLTNNYSFAYDKEMITREQAFAPHALYDKPGHPNQFHNVALNIALQDYLGLSFKGDRPIQVREGKPGTPESEQPEGWRWSPGRIPAVRSDSLPNGAIQGWWGAGSIEDVYQSAKVLQVRR